MNWGLVVEYYSLGKKKETGSGSGCFGGTSCKTCDSRDETCDTQTQHYFIVEFRKQDTEKPRA